MMSKERIWFCKIGGMAADLPEGADLPMRKAIKQAYYEITGFEAEFLFSGWGADLTEPERAAHEDRMPNEQ